MARHQSHGLAPRNAGAHQELIGQQRGPPIGALIRAGSTHSNAQTHANKQVARNWIDGD